MDLGSNIEHIGNIYSKSLTSFSPDNKASSSFLFATSSKNLIIDSIYLPKYINPVLYAVDGNISCGPITIRNTSVSGVKKTSAMSMYYAGNGDYSFSSTPYDIWVDYTSKPTKYTRVITNTTFDYSYHIDTVTKSVSRDIEFSPLNVSNEYPYEISIDKITTSPTVSVSSNNCKNCKNVSIKMVDDKYILHLEADNVTDETIATFSCTIDGIEYDATVEGHPFHGKTLVKVNATIDFNLVEDMQFSVRIEDDEEPEEQPTVEETPTEEPIAE